MINFRAIIFLFLTAFIGLIVLSGFCLAMEKHSCCQPKASDCPIISIQDASSPEAVKALKHPVFKSTPVSKPVKDKPVAPAVHDHSAAPEFSPPNYHLSAKISHQTTAPPQA